MGVPRAYKRALPEKGKNKAGPPTTASTQHESVQDQVAVANKTSAKIPNTKHEVEKTEDKHEAVKGANEESWVEAAKSQVTTLLVFSFPLEDAHTYPKMQGACMEVATFTPVIALGRWTSGLDR